MDRQSEFQFGGLGLLLYMVLYPFGRGQQRMSDGRPQDDERVSLRSAGYLCSRLRYSNLLESAMRLRKEILCRLNVNQSTSDLIPVNRITQPLADVATQQVVSTATQLKTNIATQLPAGNEVTTIT